MRTMSESITSFIPRAAGFCSSSGCVGRARALLSSSTSVFVVAAVVVGLAISSPSAAQESKDEDVAVERLRLIRKGKSGERMQVSCYEREGFPAAL